jgi:hypothetical protein
MGEKLQQISELLKSLTNEEYKKVAEEVAKGLKLRGLTPKRHAMGVRFGPR